MARCRLTRDELRALGSVSIVTVRAVTLAGVLLACGCTHWLGPKATLGPGSIVRGRGLYNEVITQTNNEQTLELIVRARYGEPIGLLSVVSVTANLRASAALGGQFGIGPSANYAGSLVPLSAGVAYEQNPTISYVPVQGERFAKSILSPIGIDVLGLLLSTERDSHRLMSVLIKQMNGLRNSMLDPPAARLAFEESIDRLARLQSAGQAAWMASANSPDSFTLVIHGYAPSNVDVVRELLRMLGLPESLARQGHDIVLPVKLAFGNEPTPQLNVQTRSVYDLIQLAATAVQVPPEHVELGLPDAGLDELAPAGGFLKIQNSREQPSSSDVLVKVWHRGWWFYLAASDGPSKSGFRFLQTLINMRLVEAAPHTTPTLTIPVGK
jgi:hypothetical protein